MFSMIEDVEEITRLFDEAGVQYQVIGGVAVNTHLLPDHRDLTFVTADLDLMMRREELPKAIEAAAKAGYEAKKMFGGHMIARPGQRAAEAVHIIFAGERTKSNQPLPNPDVQPVRRDFLGVRIPVTPLHDLIRMKLTSFRPKDLTHLQTLDEVGLIDGQVESRLPPELLPRLAEARRLFADTLPDVEQPD